MPYIYSTLANDQAYTDHEPLSDKGALQREKQRVIIKGGAGVANDRLITPLGVVTKITDQEMSVLQKNEVFRLHKQNGYIKIGNHEVDAEVMAADMTTRDESAPMVPGDFNAEHDGVSEPIVNSDATKKKSK